MQFEENKTLERVGESLGFGVGIFIFLSMLFFILTYFNKLSVSISYSYVLYAILAIYIIDLGRMVFK